VAWIMLQRRRINVDQNRLVGNCLTLYWFTWTPLQSVTADPSPENKSSPRHSLLTSSNEGLNAQATKHPSLTRSKINNVNTAHSSSTVHPVIP